MGREDQAAYIYEKTRDHREIREGSGLRPKYNIPLLL